MEPWSGFNPDKMKLTQKGKGEEEGWRERQRWSEDGRGVEREASRAGRRRDADI